MPSDQKDKELRRRVGAMFQLRTEVMTFVQSFSKCAFYVYKPDGSYLNVRTEEFANMRTALDELSNTLNDVIALYDGVTND